MKFSLIHPPSEDSKNPILNIGSNYGAFRVLLNRAMIRPSSWNDGGGIDSFHPLGLSFCEFETWRIQRRSLFQNGDFDIAEVQWRNSVILLFGKFIVVITTGDYRLSPVHIVIASSAHLM